MVKAQTKGQKTAFIIVFIVFLIYSISLIYPFIWMFLNSFKMDVDFRADSFGLPSRWIFANYFDAITHVHKGANLLVMFFHSVMNVVIICIPGQFFAACTSYILSKYRFKLNKLIFNVALVIMVIPGIGSTAATFQLWHDLGIYDTYFSLFLMGGGGFGSGFLLLYSTFSTLSWTYAEAAFIDGASNFRTFMQIMLPQVFPVMFSLFIISAIGTWNDYYTPYMYLPTKPTIAVGLFEIEANALAQQIYPMFFALMLVATAPVLLLFVMMQNTIMENVTAGGIKG
ncbi:MAG: carbohydrate ABC transporter permease [Clostridia bacterium]|nr:carbohydrate ABC transporter permease [Clostridia bacterium]